MERIIEKLLLGNQTVVSMKYKLRCYSGLLKDLICTWADLREFYASFQQLIKILGRWNH